MLNEKALNTFRVFTEGCALQYYNNNFDKSHFLPAINNIIPLFGEFEQLILPGLFQVTSKCN